MPSKPNTSFVMNKRELEFVNTHFNGSKSAAIHAALGAMMNTQAAEDVEWGQRVEELRQYVADVAEVPQSAEDVEWYIEQLAGTGTLDDEDRRFLRREFERQYGI